MSVNAVRLPVHEASRESSSQSALSECVSRTVRRYLAFHEGNQSRAATALGINRATLRKKLSQHGML
jgi:Fis family transcriptional regulator